MRTVSAAEANRHFSTLLRQVSEGERIVITSRGKPVAMMTAADHVDSPERIVARRALMARLRATPPTGPRRWTRDELYD